jgi:NodT family efflux transporter outer membrane factor (OMF) lipoprotein
MLSLLKSTIEDYKEMVRITENQYKTGTALRSDVLTAQTQLLSAQASLVQAEIARGTAEHAMATLLGRPPADIVVKEAPLSEWIPPVLPGVPSDLLERRPDIAAAERAMAAANAQIGVAFAGYYPDVTLTGTATYTNSSSLTQSLSTISPLLQQVSGTNPAWTVGLAMAQPIFDGGSVDAEVAAARATYNASVATYRQTVLTALQGVEDKLLSAKKLREQRSILKKAVANAKENVEIAKNEYQAGATTFVTVSSAETALLTVEESEISAHASLLNAAVNLVTALGGGWSDAQIVPGQAAR